MPGYRSSRSRTAISGHIAFGSNNFSLPADSARRIDQLAEVHRRSQITQFGARWLPEHNASDGMIVHASELRKGAVCKTVVLTNGNAGVRFDPLPDPALYRSRRVHGGLSATRRQIPSFV